MSGLPTPPVEDHKPQPMRRQSSKASKQSSRSSTKRSTAVHEHSPISMDGRHKRVWKACERCRMKKTKCDGESPCKRCKDDGLVCTAGSRKKTEFKQLPRGYAEVLENTQYALIATVQKLYTMVRNNESWELGEPELNDRGQPVIHDIASRLGCIRPSPDLPYAFPEGAEDFAELQAQLQAARSEMALEDTGSRMHSEDSSYSPALERTDRASSSESDHSNISKDYSQMMLSQQRQAAERNIGARVSTPVSKPSPLNIAQKPTFEPEASYRSRTSIDTSRSMPSPIYTDFQTESPMFRTTSPFSPWSAGDDFLGPAHALDLTANYMKQQTLHMHASSPLNNSIALGLDADVLKSMQLSDGLNFADGTIRPNMLDCHTGFELSDQMDAIYGGDYENQMGMA
ncbi:Fluconazole resistance protein 1 [Lachnellula cervina]|uniref:Fluconazole resistance protein 1 n=1 Tax=Lachnellula cervina TaxID=1316786 RepID=A0A7D8YN44_9HELO|nr:Fluconazole resistance protein 1 [Lachnellula cervina]